MKTDELPRQREWKSQPPRSLALAVAAIGLALFVLAGILATRGRFVQVIQEFKLPISFVTSFVLGPLLPFILGTLIVVTIVKEWIPELHSTANFWNRAVLGCALSVLMLYLFGVIEPLSRLINSMSQ